MPLKQSWTTRELCQLPCAKNRTVAGVMEAYPELSVTGLHVVSVCRFAMSAKSVGVCVCSKCAQSPKEVTAGGAGPIAGRDAGLSVLSW